MSTKQIFSVWRCLIKFWHSCMRCPSNHSVVLASFLQRLSTCVQIIGDNLLNSPVVLWLFLRSFEQSTDDHHTPPTLTAWRWPHSFLLKASRSWNQFPLFMIFFKFLLPLRIYVFNIHLRKHFKFLLRSFPQPDKIFQLHSLFDVHCSFHSAHSWTTRKRGVKKSACKNSMIAES